MPCQHTEACSYPHCGCPGTSMGDLQTAIVKRTLTAVVEVVGETIVRERQRGNPVDGLVQLTTVLNERLVTKPVPDTIKPPAVVPDTKPVVVARK